MVGAVDRELPEGYVQALEDLKGRIRSAQIAAHRTVNTQLVSLYWSIGQSILGEQQKHGWGARVVTQLAADLRRAFPSMTGLSRRNLLYMRAFAAAWPDLSVVQRPVAQLPWGHITVLLDRLDTDADRDWYAAAADQHAWSRNVLANQIANRTRDRIGAAPSNFDTQLASVESDLVAELVRDPYVFDFLELRADVAERELEQALTDRLVETLRELGAGFAFVGRQVLFEVEGDDFYLDLLFFHVEQLRYVVVELKTGRFEPEYAGKLGFYIALVDDQLRRPAHQPTVGILICGSRNDHTVRYALSRANSPMAVSTYTYDRLPAAEQAALPDAATLTAALNAAQPPSTDT